MADSFSSKARSFVVAILIGLLVIAFAIWGVEDVFNQRSGSEVLKIGDAKVSSTEFNRVYRARLRSLAEEENVTLTDEQAFTRGIHRQVLSELLGNKIVEVDADELGIGVNAKSARDYLETIDAFKDDLTGEFSMDQMAMILRQQNPPISVDEFEQDLISSMRQQQTLPAISGGVKAPLQFAEQRYKYVTEQRKANVLTLTEQSVPAAPEPTDEELKTYISANPIRFTAPEYRRITMLRLDPQDFVLMNDESTFGVQSMDKLETAFNNIFVTEEEIKGQFDYKIELGEIGSPAKRSLVQITANSEENAKDIAEKLEAGLTADEITAIFGLVEPITYTDVVEEAILDPEAATAAFEMKNGEIKALMGAFGNWITVQVTAATDEVKPDLNTIKDEIVADILSAKAKDKIFDLMGAVQDQVDEGRSLEEAAAINGLPFSTLDFVDRSGATRSGERLVGIGDFTGVALDEEILTNIFTADQDYETDYFDTAGEGLAMIRVDEIIESQPKPFEEVRDQAAALWKTEKVEENLNDLMLDLSSKAQTGETLETIYAGIENGASLEEVMLVRTSPTQKLGARITVDLLDASIGDIKRGDGPTRLTRQIAILEDIISNQDSLGGEYADFIQNQVTAELISDLQLAYRQAVLADHPMVENPDRVRQILGVEAPAEE